MAKTGFVLGDFSSFGFSLTTCLGEDTILQLKIVPAVCLGLQGAFVAEKPSTTRSKQKKVLHLLPAGKRHALTHGCELQHAWSLAFS